MDIKEFVKKDFAKLGNVFNGKSLRTITMVGGLAMWFLGNINERNDRAALRDEIAEDVLKKLSSGENKK